MLTQPLRQTAEYQSLLAAVAGHVPAAAALFGLPPTARAQVPVSYTHLDVYKRQAVHLLPL